MVSFVFAHEPEFALYGHSCKPNVNTAVTDGAAGDWG
jgi:hypothetical protein